MEWHVAIIRQSKDGLTEDEFACQPGTEMRKRLSKWFKENLAGKESFFYLTITHRVSARQMRTKITKDGKVYRADISGTPGTLEQGVKALKDQLTAQWRAMSEWRQ